MTQRPAATLPPTRPDDTLDRHFHTASHPGLRLTLAAGALATATAIITTLVTLAATNPDPQTSYVAAPPSSSLSGDSPVAPPALSASSPGDLTLRAIVDPSASPTHTVTLYLGLPGEPVPDVPLSQLAPAGDATITCTPTPRDTSSAIAVYCEGAALTPYGSITFAGAVTDPGNPLLTVTGGTGRLANASGTLGISSVSPTQQDWSFELGTP